MFLTDSQQQEYIDKQLDSLVTQSETSKVLILSDFTYLSELKRIVESSRDVNCFETIRLIESNQENLHFEPCYAEVFVQQTSNSGGDSQEASVELQPYLPFDLKRNLLDYDHVVYLGECRNLELIINCRQITILDPFKRSQLTLDGQREFRKRVSLIERVRKQASSLIGFVFVNYSQSVTPIMVDSNRMCKKLKKTPYFITLNQQDYELRLGNFGQLESFVMINNCRCELPIARDTSRFLYPVVFWREFRIVCGQTLRYGGIDWNVKTDEERAQEEADQNGEDEEHDPESMKLVDRDLFKKPDTWYGLVVDPGSVPVEPIKQGLSGIPANYFSEKELF